LSADASVKIGDGTEIPKGSKLVGRVIDVQASGAGENSQVALQFDHVELKGGQSVAVHSQIQSIAPPHGMASTGGSAGGGAMSGPQARGSTNPSRVGLMAAGRRAVRRKEQAATRGQIPQETVARRREQPNASERSRATLYRELL
jgi:hypothetical protein